MAARPLGTALAILLLVGLLPAAAGATGAKDDGDDEVRVAGRCGPGATSKLKVKADDDGLEVELEVDQNRVGVRWRVVLVHERRVAWRGTARTRRPSGSFTVERLLPDLPGADTVTVRATAPGGLTCRASATLPGT